MTREFTQKEVDSLLDVAQSLRDAQRRYLSERNEENGQQVGRMTSKMDKTLQNLMVQDTSSDSHENQSSARGLVEACLGLRQSQHDYLHACLMNPDEKKEIGQQVGEAAARLDKEIEGLTNDSCSFDP